MGLLKDSKQKSKLIKKIAKANEKNLGVFYDDDRIDTDGLMKELWETLFKFPPIEAVIAKHGYTFDKFKDDSERLLLDGYGWERGDYIPLSILCFAPPLDFYLSNIEEYDARGEYSLLVYKTTEVLKSM